MATDELAAALQAIEKAKAVSRRADDQAVEVRRDLSLVRDLIGQEDAWAPRIREALQLRMFGGK